MDGVKGATWKREVSVEIATYYGLHGTFGDRL